MRTSDARGKLLSFYVLLSIVIILSDRMMGDIGKGKGVKERGRK